ncbi:hypothetical protein HJG60_010661 [Phyllostomus discolor]|uniref:Uncharacterized protein n=1 Tax=Phyllostomus discolor TaxID=89673 RepID=A0A834EHP9_9CHIR|nr:hypothetical protein HJG60_010661 [Phyllostomus discolor]
MRSSQMQKTFFLVFCSMACLLQPVDAHLLLLRLTWKAKASIWASLMPGVIPFFTSLFLFCMSLHCLVSQSFLFSSHYVILSILLQQFCIRAIAQGRFCFSNHLKISETFPWTSAMQLSWSFPSEHSGFWLWQVPVSEPPPLPVA